MSKAVQGRYQMTVEQHLKRYHKQWYEATIEEARQRVERELPALPDGTVIKYPIYFPLCKVLPFGVCVHFSFRRNRKTGRVEIE